MKKIITKIIITALFLVVMIPCVSSAQITMNATTTITHTLSLHAQGSEVMFLQNFLKDQGFYDYSVSTGYFGSITKQAVIAFQKKYGINPIGVVGPATRAKIAELLIIKNNNHTGSVDTSEIKSGYIHHSGNKNTNDTTAPVVTISNLNLVHFSTTTPSFEATATDDTGVTRFYFKVDGVSAGAESSDGNLFRTMAPITEGEHVLTAVAYDAAGNVTTSDPYSFYIDTIAPLLTITSPGGSSINTDPVALSASVIDSQNIDSVVVTIYDAAPPNNVIYTHTFNSEPYNITWSNGAPDGSYIVEFTATDAAGNVGTAMKALSITVDIVNYNLTINKVGGGVGTVISSPAGISCGATCAASFASGAMVSLSAIPAMGSMFSGWSGGGCFGTGACVVTMTGATSVSAVFDPI